MPLLDSGQKALNAAIRKGTGQEKRMILDLQGRPSLLSLNVHSLGQSPIILTEEMALMLQTLS